MRIYDSMTRKKREFMPIEEGKIRMYVCGPTVYNKIHIGNARTFISFDVIRRYLEYRGYEVTYVQNLTDCDDKIINKANEQQRTPEEVTKEYISKFLEDMHAANVLDPTIRPRATQEIPEMIELIETLIDKGNAYVEDGDVYFDVSSDKNYGCLSGRDVENAQSGHRELIAEGLGIEKRKHSKEDFALWKTSKPGEPAWDSPWGKGRPGWHTECVCMSKKYLGLPFDIHGGGSDLMFPHHENEIAQAQCAWENGFANIWMHSGMLNVDGEKMSKSLNNFFMLDEVLEKHTSDELRMLVLQTHYRSSLNFSFDRLIEAKKALMKVEICIDNIKWLIDHATDSRETSIKTDVKNMAEKCKSDFIENMDDDFNAPAAVGQVNKFVGELNRIYKENTPITKADCKNAQAAIDAIKEMFGALGIELATANHTQEAGISQQIVTICAELNISPKGSDSETLDAIIEMREQARKSKQWDVSDKIRDLIQNAGWTIEDTPLGTKIKR